MGNIPLEVTMDMVLNVVLELLPGLLLETVVEDGMEELISLTLVVGSDADLSTGVLVFVGQSLTGEQVERYNFISASANSQKSDCRIPD